MEKFCDFITNPAWWGVIATIIAAVVAAIITYVLGKRQNKLQEQQLKIQERQNDLQEQQVKLQEQQAKAQEYELYISLYRIVKNMDLLIAEHITTLIAYYGMFRNAAYEQFSEKISHVSKYIEELDNRWIDFELKFPQEKDTIEKYKSVLTDVKSTYQLLNNLVIFEKEENRDAKKIRMRCRGLSCEDDYETKTVLLSLLGNRSTKKRLDICLSNFLKDKEDLQNRNLLGKIAKHCNPE